MIVQRSDRRTWGSEACDRCFDPASGAKIIQITSSPQCSLNIYCEQPYCSTDGRRFAFFRRADTTVFENWLMVADLSRLYVTAVAFDVVGVFNAAWSGIVYFYTTERKFKRLNLTDLRVDDVDLGFDVGLFGRAGSVSPDQRYIICYEPVGDTHTIRRIDLEKGTAETIFEDPEMCNPHMQFNPIDGQDILVQLNRGSRSNKDKVLHQPVDMEKGVTHFVINRDGNNRRTLPFGPPFSASSTGHSNWLADSGQITCTTHFNSEDPFRLRHDDRTPDGNILIARPGDGTPSVFPAQDIFSVHISASRCGRYFVADSWPGSFYDDQKRFRSAAIVIGSVETGKYRTLVSESLSSGGGGEHNHVHAYLTADNRHVIYNANPFFSPTQVFAAEIPEGFLESLS